MDNFRVMSNVKVGRGWAAGGGGGGWSIGGGWRRGKNTYKALVNFVDMLNNNPVSVHTLQT